MSALGFLQDWYTSQCNEDWEHEFGVRIATLDNPGWVMEVDLIGTEIEGRRLEKSKLESAPGRWIWSSSDGEKFMSSCDQLSLEEMIFRFKDFSEGRIGS
ncbi:Imm53 family immunity protein [Kitasatospora sp. NPDC101447]|uniref:Imm53 family immunity protein n=1 Tax=Kitasatospora sp. NPDC101447 TaxID=3364102 RepID=UPI00380E58AA